MSVSLNTYAGAVAAYQKAAGGAVPQNGAAAEATSEGSAGGFANLVRSAAQSAMDTAATGEQMSMAALQGKADISQVVTAVAEAEVTLQTVVAVRDKVMEAYNDIIRMPI